MLQPLTPHTPLVQMRAAAKKQSAGKYKGKVHQKERHKRHVAANPAPRDEFEGVFRG